MTFCVTGVNPDTKVPFDNNTMPKDVIGIINYGPYLLF